MADGWPTVPLESVVRFQEGPGILAKDFHSNGVPLVRLAGLGGYRVTLNGCDYLDPALVARKWSHFKLNKGDIVISTSASFGRPAVVGDEAEGAVFYTGLIRFRSSSSCLDEGYLKTFLGSRVFMLQAEAQASGSVISHFGPSHLRRMEIPLPPMMEQQNIARVHSAIDDKIDLNRRMNATLEAMARAIFKDWFVDFGPTRAKMEGRAPYLAPEIWSLFPDRLDEEGKPEGWRSVPLDQIADFLNGLALQKYPGAGEADLPVIKIAELRAGNASGTDRASSAIPSQYVVADGDVLFSWSGSLIQRVWTGGRGALNQHLFKVTSKSWPKWLHYFWVDHHLPNFQAIAASKATTMGHIQRHHLSEAETFLGPDDVMSAADRAIAPLFQRIVANDMEARTLAATRDLLLPKLMSGELRVQAAERAVEAVA
jgi:type I restriction enzyme S subunit